MKRTVGRKNNKSVAFLAGIWCLCMAMNMDVQAAGTVAVTTDKTSVFIGDTVSVTVQTSEPEDPATVPEISVTYDSDILTMTGCSVEYGGGGGLVTFKGQSAVITFQAVQTGNVSVGAEAVIDDDGANPATGSAVLTVGASTQEGLSSDATLYVLGVSPGEMIPEFSSQVTDYRIVIGNDVTDITVSGAVSDSGAQITAASGFKNLKEGTNQAVITVTAEDGTTLSYHFTIVREETSQTEEDTEQEEKSGQTDGGWNVTVDNVSYTVQSTFSDELLPEGCIRTEAEFNGQQVEAAKFEKGGLILLYAIATDGGEGAFFIYNNSTEKLQAFVQLYSIENRFIVPIEAQDNPPAQFKADKMQWNNSLLPAFALEDRSIENADAFYLLYAVSNEGERGFYLYDAVEGSYQRFLNYTGAQMAEVTDTGSPLGKASIIIIAVLSILLVGAIILIVNLIIGNKEMQEKEKPERPAKPKKSAKPPKPEKPITKEPPVKQEPTKQEVKKPPVTPAAENIPIKVVPTPKTEVKRPAVTIYTLERQPVQLTREAPPDQLDDDFEFEFINIDNE